jgi:hypothetical protein
MRRSPDERPRRNDSTKDKLEQFSSGVFGRHRKLFIGLLITIAILIILAFIASAAN